MTQDHRRFADDKLNEFYEEFVDHIDKEREMQSNLTASVDQNTRMVREIHRDTKDLLEAWQAAQGALKVIATMGRAVKWVAGLLAAVGVIWYTVRHGGTPPK